MDWQRTKSTLRSRRWTLAALGATAMFLLLANFSGFPYLPRYLRKSQKPPATGQIEEWVVYGWPVAWESRYQVRKPSGFPMSGCGRSTGEGYTDLAIGLGILAFLAFVADLLHYRELASRFDKNQDTANEEGLPWKSFRAKWLLCLRVAVAASLMLLGVVGIYSIAEDVYSEFTRHPPEYHYVYEGVLRKSATSASVVSNDWNRVGRTTSRAVAGLVASSLVFAGVLLMAWRFPLRWLVFGVLVMGLVASLPFAFRSPAPETYKALVSLGFDNEFSPLEVKSITDRLRPNRALATLPREMLEELRIDQAACLDSAAIKSETRNGGVGIGLELVYNEGLTGDQRGELFRFYADYFHLLATEAAVRNGATVRSSMNSHSRSGGIWERWTDEWKKRRRQRLLDEAK